MKPLMTALILSSLCGCAKLGIKGPDTNAYGVTYRDETKSEFQLRGYNLRNDYDSNGNRKPTATPKMINIDSLEDLIGWTCTNPSGLKNLKVFAADARDEIQKRCK